jgi:hypothetical protein
MILHSPHVSDNDTRQNGLSPFTAYARLLAAVHESGWLRGIAERRYAQRDDLFRQAQHLAHCRHPQPAQAAEAICDQFSMMYARSPSRCGWAG